MRYKTAVKMSEKIDTDNKTFHCSTRLNIFLYAIYIFLRQKSHILSCIGCYDVRKIINNHLDVMTFIFYEFRQKLYV